MAKWLNELIRINQINCVRSENMKLKRGCGEWWKAVNVMTGRKKQDESISSVFSIDGINTYFQSINTDPNYCQIIECNEYALLIRPHRFCLLL